MMKILYILLFTILISCSDNEKKSITIYSGRKTSLSEWIFKKFEKETGIKIKKKVAPTQSLVNLILAEKSNSPADLFYAQDASSLSLLSQKELLSPINKNILKKAFQHYQSKNKDWVGASGRLRVLVYNSQKVKKNELPKTIFDLQDSKWKGKVGWAPENSSFQSHIAYMIGKIQKNKILNWLKKMKQNKTKVYPKNTPIVEAVIRGEISLGLVNHYYLYKINEKFKKSTPAKNYVFPNGDLGTFMNISGLGILKHSKKKQLAEKFIKFVLKDDIQKLFQENNYEFPVSKGSHKGLILEDLGLIKQQAISFEKIGKLKDVYELLKKSKVLSF